MEQCVEVVVKQIQEVILSAVKILIVDVSQTITGKELHQVIVKSIKNYLPKTAAAKFISNVKKKVHTPKIVSLGAVLDNFIRLKDEPQVREHDDEPLKLIEETIRKHYVEGAEGVPDTSVLKERVEKLHDAYATVLRRRTREKGRLKKWSRVIRDGNDSFRKVYDNVWEQV